MLSGDRTFFLWVLNRVSALPKSVLSGMQDWLGSQRMTMATTSFHGCKDLPWRFTGAGLSSFFCYCHLPALGHNSDFFPRQSSSYTVNYKNMNISLRERTKRVINRRQLLDGTSQIKRSLNVNSTNTSRFIDPAFSHWKQESSCMFANFPCSGQELLLFSL